MSVFFSNKESPIKVHSTKALCRVAPSGSSLFPAIAAAIIDLIYARQGISEKTAGLILRPYLQAFPQAQTSPRNLSALEQWQSMLKISGTAARVSIQLSQVLQKMIYAAIESHPAYYCRGIAELEHFDSAMQYQPERVLAMAILAATADCLSLGISLKVIEGTRTLPAQLHFATTEGAIEITLDKSTDLFQPHLQRGEKFQNMFGLAGGSKVTAPIDLEFFRHSLLETIQEIIGRYTMMWKAGEIDYPQLLTSYIEMDNQGSQQSIPYISIPSISSAQTELPAPARLLVNAMAWLEATQSPAIKHHLREEIGM
ncbi:MAG: hypothetical protein JJT82_09465 [Legionellaceae bacterium]|nr:hypothetical protein [Legionellaceae bacterium]